MSIFNFHILLGVYAYMGNYQSFGNSKFIPNMPKESFEKIVKSSQAWKEDQEVMNGIWESCHEKMFSLAPNELNLDLPPNGVTKYFSDNCIQEDADLVQRYAPCLI